jgi:acyl carrier protein
LQAGLGADSLDELEVLMELEDAFGLTISDEACARLGGWTVGEIADYVAARA